MAETCGASTPSLKGLREQMVAAAQALADERRNQSGVSPVPVPASITIKTATKPVIDGSLLRSEERQRLARERREEQAKQHAAKESQILEKEKKAKLQYEKQMEEKQRKLKEQKLKEQQRRAAVEEKRKQKIEEEKEHYEAVVHRTLERNQRLETRQKRWSWSGSVTDSDGKTEPPPAAEANKHSTSSVNLKQAEISKRLSSSAALLNAPSKSTTKRSASLNRLNNKVPLNSEQPVSKGLQVDQKGAMEKKRSSSLNRMGNKLQSSPDLENVQKEEKAASNSSPAQGPKAPVRSRSIDRLKTITTPSSDNISLEYVQKPEVGKQSLSPAGRRAPSPSLSSSGRSPSPAKLGKRPPSPAAIRQKNRPPSPSFLRQKPPSPVTVSKPAPIQRPSLTPNVLNVPKKKTDVDCKPNEKMDETAGQEKGASLQISEREIAVNSLKTKEDASSKSASGTTTAEEAARLLAEKRRLAREQREREVLERAQKEEEERVKKENEAKRALEEQAQREDELRQQEEQRKIAEAEQQRLAEKERLRREEEEQEKLAELQQQREEAEAKAQEEAYRHQQERERIMQQNMQERLERRKRIEEIMKRTRKAEQNEAKNEEKSNDEDEDVEEEEEEEEEDDLGLEKQDQPEKAKYVDSPLEDAPESLLQEASKIDPDDVFVNGDEQLEVKDENSEHFTQIKETSPPAKEAVIENSGILHVNEANHPIGFLSNLNGKSLAWNFEEIIDLGVIPKTTRQSADSIAAEISNQNLKDAATVPPSPKLVFEEESTMNPLTKPIETASEL
ncbi:MAP7 domain-containing protein 3 isoform X6 [Sphaerodactylus townsendi]|uniref:MAP7 domain-containing protein 3 isoform X6 n=1 Tax=Sphaerodactylus townsendi TaxID=933632 RepID=UPI002026C05D|nr:MAP7 domain-containing protein 3 isoform X6 [Sphaerodactylus townsendi]